jgi:hypothetical protein
MIMRADLDRAVASICDHQRHGRAAGVDLDVAGRGKELAGDQAPSQSLRGALGDQAISCRGASAGARLLRVARNDTVSVNGSARGR